MKLVASLFSMTLIALVALGCETITYTHIECDVYIHVDTISFEVDSVTLKSRPEGYDDVCYEVYGDSLGAYSG